jgi:hypothetical protein
MARLRCSCLVVAGTSDTQQGNHYYKCIDLHTSQSHDASLCSCAEDAPSPSAQEASHATSTATNVLRDIANQHPDSAPSTSHLSHAADNRATTLDNRSLKLSGKPQLNDGSLAWEKQRSAVLLQLQRQNAQLNQELQYLRCDQSQHDAKLNQLREQHDDDIRRAQVGH